MKVHSIDFTLPEDFDETTDLYLPAERPMRGIIYPNAREVEMLVGYNDIVNFLVQEAKKQTKLEFSLVLEYEGERMVFRGHSIDSAEGKIFIFRRLPSYIPDIKEIGLPKGIIELLLSERLNSGGLIVIAGETGQGKSTTAASVIDYRLKMFSSFCLTIEDPIELPLQGFYPNEKDETKQGVCFQTEISAENDIYAMLKSSLRCYPSSSNSILYVGEIRDSVMASEVLKIAANGHLVVTTVHGADIEVALKRLISLASSIKNNSEEEARSMLSSVFKLMIHQKIQVAPNGTKKLVARVLFSESASSQTANRIKRGDVGMLNSEIEQQNLIIQRGGSLFGKF